MIRTIIHYSLHLIAPGVIAFKFYPETKLKVWTIMLATMIIDLDHLLATPIFDPNRCSIEFHPLHTSYALAVYILFLFFRKTRIIGIGLTLHFFTDFLDCFLMKNGF